MFGKEYANHLDILNLSFKQMNDRYQKKAESNNKNSLVQKLKKLYVLVFGIPEIGFQIRSMYFKKILTSYLLNNKLTKILDAGSGIGAYTFWLGKKFTKAKVVGGEIDKNKLYSCRAMTSELHANNVTFVKFDITKIQRKAAYDLIVCIDVLEHIKDYNLVLKNFLHLLRNDGYLFIHVPQPNQKRIFRSLTTWHHENHIHDGIAQSKLENVLNKLGFRIVVSKETHGFFGKLAWELNHLTLSKSFFIASLIYPLLYIIAMVDFLFGNKNGLGIAILAKKENYKKFTLDKN